MNKLNCILWNNQISTWFCKMLSVAFVWSMKTHTKNILLSLCGTINSPIQLPLCKMLSDTVYICFGKLTWTPDTNGRSWYLTINYSSRLLTLCAYVPWSFSLCSYHLYFMRPKSKKYFHSIPLNIMELTYSGVNLHIHSFIRFYTLQNRLNNRRSGNLPAIQILLNFNIGTLASAGKSCSQIFGESQNFLVWSMQHTSVYYDDTFSK